MNQILGTASSREVLELTVHIVSAIGTVLFAGAGVAGMIGGLMYWGGGKERLSDVEDDVESLKAEVEKLTSIKENTK